jgi:hypothetical protein
MTYYAILNLRGYISFGVIDQVCYSGNPYQLNHTNDMDNITQTFQKIVGDFLCGLEGTYKEGGVRNEASSDIIRS